MSYYNSNLQNYFNEIFGDNPRDLSFIIVSHVLPDVVDFLHFLSQKGEILGIIAKPNSINKKIYGDIKKNYKILNITKEKIKEDNFYDAFFPRLKIKGQLIIFDIGGYFAPVIERLTVDTRISFGGIIEDTENGFQKYENILLSSNEKIQIYSVARSQLKDAEDFLVGTSIIFSAERIIREFGCVFNGKRIGVIGYGKIGSSIITNLSGRRLNTSLADHSAMKRVVARAFGFNTVSRKELLEESDVIFCATGNKSIRDDEFTRLKNGSFVISATSSDDEFDLNYINKNYKKTNVSSNISKYSSEQNYFYLLNDGNTVNFLDKTSVCEYIHLVQGEMVMALRELVEVKGANSNKINECNEKNKALVAELWEKYFWNQLNEWSH